MARRWLKIGAGIAATVTTLTALFALLVLQFNFVITDLTGSFPCIGTYESLDCDSQFVVKNPTNATVDIYSKLQVKLEFSPEIQDYALFVPDGRCSATGKCACDMKEGHRVGFKGWRCVDFTNKTKVIADLVYNFRFNPYSETRFRIIGIKKHPGDNVKWTFGVSGGELDPVWEGSNEVITWPNADVPGTKRWEKRGNDTGALSKYLDVEFTQINETHWSVRFKLNATVKQKILDVLSDSEGRKALAVELFGKDADSKAIDNIASFPVKVNGKKVLISLLGNDKELIIEEGKFGYGL